MIRFPVNLFLKAGVVRHHYVLPAIVELDPKALHQNNED
jgi:hypothetical protein